MLLHSCLLLTASIRASYGTLPHSQPYEKSREEARPTTHLPTRLPDRERRAVRSVHPEAVFLVGLRREESQCGLPVSSDCRYRPSEQNLPKPVATIPLRCGALKRPAANRTPSLSRALPREAGQERRATSLVLFDAAFKPLGFVEWCKRCPTSSRGPCRSPTDRPPRSHIGVERRWTCGCTLLRRAR